MKAVTDWLKEKKKLIIVIALIALLIAIVFLFFGGEERSGDFSKTDKELRLTALLESMDGIGEAEVMITEEEGLISGVVVVCEGADRIAVRNDILNAVSTALDINKNIIAIYSM